MEGIEGAGKSTHVRQLVADLAALGLDVAATREPGGTAAAEAVRQLLLSDAVADWLPISEALLHYAARRDHVERTVEPALAAGRWVVSDRFADSTMAYQGYGQHLGPDVVARLHTLILGEFQPDLTLILDLDVDAGLDRVRRRSPLCDRYERMDRDFHERVRAGFLEIAEHNPGRCRVINAADPPEVVTAAVRRAVRGRLHLDLPG